jgi:hypothetical protein
MRNFNIKKLFVDMIGHERSLNIALSTMWWYSWFCLKTLQSLEMMFKVILMLPNSVLSITNKCRKQIKNDDGETINIVHARDGNNLCDVTNKLQLFLQYYWEIGGFDCMYEKNGFDFDKLVDLLGCSSLYCSYLITNKNCDLTPGEFIKNIKSFMIVEKDNDKPSDNISNNKKKHKKHRRYKKVKQDSTTEDIYLSHVVFE